MRGGKNMSARFLTRTPLLTDGREEILKGILQPKDVHEQYGIRFYTPMFDDFTCETKIKAKMYLYKPSTGSKSQSLDFYFCPNKRKSELLIHRIIVLQLFL